MSTAEVVTSGSGLCAAGPLLRWASWSTS